MRSKTVGIFFYNTMQVCNNKDNCMSGVGTGVLYRRAAIDDIGGIPVKIRRIKIDPNGHLVLLLKYDL